MTQERIDALTAALVELTPLDREDAEFLIGVAAGVLQRTGTNLPLETLGIGLSEPARLGKAATQ